MALCLERGVGIVLDRQTLNLPRAQSKRYHVSKCRREDWQIPWRKLLQECRLVRWKGSCYTKSANGGLALVVQQRLSRLRLFLSRQMKLLQGVEDRSCRPTCGVVDATSTGRSSSGVHCKGGGVEPPVYPYMSSSEGN